MKRCPLCGFTTDDDEVLFCGNDGTRLVENPEEKFETKEISKEEIQETIISEKIEKEPTLEKDVTPKEENKIDLTYGYGTENEESVITADSEITDSEQRPISANIPQEEEKKSETEYIAHLITEKTNLEEKNLRKGIIIFFLIATCIGLLIGISSQSEKLNKQKQQYYPDLVCDIGEFYGIYDGEYVSRPFKRSELDTVICDFSIISDGISSDDKDDFSVELYNVSDDYYCTSFNISPNEHRVKFNRYDYSYWDVGWYIVRWMFDGEIIAERSFYVNW